MKEILVSYVGSNVAIAQTTVGNESLDSLMTMVGPVEDEDRNSVSSATLTINGDLAGTTLEGNMGSREHGVRSCILTFQNNDVYIFGVKI